MNKLAAKNVMKRLYELALSGASEQYLAGACEIAVMAGMAKTTRLRSGSFWTRRQRMPLRRNKERIRQEEIV